MTTELKARREMTDQEGLALAASVAEQVMGWHSQFEGIFAVWVNPDETSVIAKHLFRPDKDIASAWVLVERMRELGFDVHVSVTEKGCYCEIYRWKTGSITPMYRQMSSENVPDVICRAALGACK